MSNLKKMGTLAKTGAQKNIFKQCMLTVLLSGQLNTYGDRDTKKQFYTMARTINFIPGFFAKDFNHQEKTIYLLNKASNGEFEKDINDKLKKSELSLNSFHSMSEHIDIGKLHQAIADRWNSKGNKIEEFCSLKG
jgi:hypothetical protein